MSHTPFSWTLLTDLYQLTMGYGYYKAGIAEREAVFHLFFRRYPFGGNYAIAAGLQAAITWLRAFKFDDSDLAFLATLCGNDGLPLFSADYLQYLGNLSFSCDIDAMPEGTLAHPHQPLLRVRGRLIEGQLIETALLNMLNFQTLIATQAARICQATQGESVLEFGLRRAQGVDGALSASRAAYIGGCAATSNVLAAKLYDIPVRGTHAHSWVMCFDTELAAFEQYAQVMPNNCIFLVDTYNTIEGVKNAIRVGQQLRQRGYSLAGVRLDSGDMAQLSIEARQLLDQAGFADALIVASNDLDEQSIIALKAKGAKIGVWGVGTNLVTAAEQPALGGVYKLGAIKDANGAWEYRIKLSEMPIKTSNPGILQVRRYTNAQGNALADMLYDELNTPTKIDIVSHDGASKRHIDPASIEQNDLLQPIFRQGKCVYDTPKLSEIRQYAQQQLANYEAKDFTSGLAENLYQRKAAMIQAKRHEN
jgi:nicotinate phosphoribosyltransferase